MRWVVVLAGFGCGGGPLPMPPDPTPPEQTIPLTDTTLGPLTAETPANLVELRKLLVGYQVTPINLPADDETSLVFEVLDGDKPLFVIIPAEGGSIANVRIASSRVVARNQWRVGAPFTGKLTACECWGGMPVCFRRGEHVGIGFERSCHGNEKIRRPDEGKRIERLLWSPRPLGQNVDSDVDTPLIDDP